jgi:undecaprenyl-diphosphatase
LLGQNLNGSLAFDAVLQLSASCALLVYFWKDIFHLIKVFLRWVRGLQIESSDKTLLLSIILGTIPAVIFGILLESYMDTVFRNIHLVALTLVLGSVLFWFAQKKSKVNKDPQTLTVGRGIVIGFFQCLALVPGISRSGATISGGLLTGISQDRAVRFSFLLSIPILFGAGLKKLYEVRSVLFETGYGTSLLLGSITAFVVGLLSINFLIKYLKNHDLNVFIWYRIALSIAIFLIF